MKTFEQALLNLRKKRNYKPPSFDEVMLAEAIAILRKTYQLEKPSYETTVTAVAVALGVGVEVGKEMVKDGD